MPPVCFVTGASGFVGANLVPLLAKRFRLRLLMRPGSTVATGPGLDQERIDGSLEDANALERGVRGADVVVHLAALVSFRPEDRAAMQRVNVDATARLAAFAREHRVRRFLHVSTISAIAYRNRPEVIDETAPYNYGPLRIGYCDTKHFAEQAVSAEVGRGLDAVIVNPPSMYGAGDRRKSEGSLMEALLAGRIAFAPPGGLAVADVADVCRGCVQAIERGRTGERYVLGGENLSGKELFARLARIAGGRAPRFCPPAWLVRGTARALRAVEAVRGSRPPLTSEVLALAPRWLWFSSEKARRELGYAPGSVDRGIAAAVAELRARRGAGGIDSPANA